MTLEAREKCLAQGCTRRRQVRGLCRACLRWFYRAVEAGKTTEQAEIDAGRILRPHEDERENANPYGHQLRTISGQQSLTFE